MGVFVYSPGVRIIVSTKNAGIIEVTDDIANGTLTLRENAPHSLQFSLLNMGRKYDALFTPNDRLVCYMKRVSWLLCFSGYLNTVPYFSVYPRSVQLDATCTLKRLQYHFWDPGTDASYALMFGPGSGAGAPGEASTDGGMQQRLNNVLTQVAEWDPDKIHIGAIPGDWITKIASLEQAVAADATTNMQAVAAAVAANAVGAAPSIGGNDPLSQGRASISTIPGSSLPISFGQVAPANDTSLQGTFGLTAPESSSSPRDPWYCAMQWPYRLAQPLPNGAVGPPTFVNPGVGAPGTSAYQAAVQFWTNQPILVVNPTNNKAVVLRAVAWGPSSSSASIAMSQQAMDALGINAGDSVHMAFAPGGAADGPYTVSASSSSTSAAPAASPAPGQQVALPLDPQYLHGGTVDQGVDYAAPGNTPLFAMGPGTIIGAGISGFGPNCPILQITGGPLAGRTIYYGHAGPNTVAVGATVTAGQQISVVGPGIVGISTGPHLEIGFYPPSTTPGGAPMLSFINSVIAGGGTAPQVPSSGGGSTGPPPNGLPTAFDSLLNTYDWIGGGPDPTSDILSGPRALMNDVPLLPTIDMLSQGSMRSYCSAPNGDFIAWFPDYFGAYKTAAVMVIDKIELQDFTIVWSDANLVTHQFTAGAPVGAATGDTPGGDVSATQMFTTVGIVSVEQPAVLNALFNLGDGQSPFGSSQDILNRYGARPNFVPMGTIPEHSPAEFWYALALFQRNWAQQFTAQVPMTFMPELFPGMLIQLPDFAFQAYVNQVVHNFDFSGGGGFTTDAYISAPSRLGPNGGSLWMLQQAGVGV